MPASSPMSSAPRQGSRERGREREPREERSEREQERARARRRRRIAIAQRLGFPTVRAFARWRDEIALDHFAAFLCDYLSRGYTVVPGCGKDFVGFVDLERAVERRLAMLEARRFEVALDPDKSEWTAKDHYKQFIVGVVADDVWLAKYGVGEAEMWSRGWTAKELTVNMYKLLEFLIEEWQARPGDNVPRVKVRYP